MIPSSGHLFYVDDLDEPQLSDGDDHHARRVLRLRNGEELSICNGRGAWRRATWAGRIEAISEIVHEPTTTVPLSVGFALVKGSKPELVVQKLTEVGIDRIVAVVAERSVVKWDAEKAAANVDRWKATARAAGMQSRRAFLPEISAPALFADVVAMGGWVRADRDGAALGPTHRSVMIGPEGGWSPAERKQLGTAVSVGPHVLRAETAAIVVGGAMNMLRWESTQHAG